MTISQHHVRPDLPILDDPASVARVAAVREQIAAGTYETDAKIDLACDRLLADIAREQIDQARAAMDRALPSSEAEMLCSTDTCEGE